MQYKDPEQVDIILKELKARADKMPKVGKYKQWPQEFKDEVKALRQESGLSGHALGKALNISSSQIHRWSDEDDPKPRKSASKKVPKKPAKPSKPSKPQKPNGVKNGINKQEPPRTSQTPAKADTLSALALLVVPTSSHSASAKVATLCLSEIRKIASSLETTFPDLNDEDDLNRQLRESGGDLKRYVGIIEAALTPLALG